jgi:DUF4097 and DUF4098 domain-containing protein YvlB
MLPLLVAAAVTFPVTPRTTLVMDLREGDVRVVGSNRTDVEIEAERATAAMDGDRIVVRSEPGARARVEVRAPSGIAVDSIRIVDGQLRLDELSGRVAADVRQGDIRAAGLGGIVRLETGFGDVVVERARLTEGGLLRLRAFNGSVRLTLADRPTNARILALTFNGKIESNLPLTRREAFGPKFAEATFGAGEPVISLDSVAGDISINVAASRRQ